ncbi:MAG TPA: hypothetical protein VKC66_34245 [Xanthobacteraceae bacterium]|nr:hypothetical protein [Xanthobacteraceae bacterium]
MFGKTAKFPVARLQVVGALQAAPSAVAHVHSNDNTVIARAASGPCRRRRRNLLCHWRPRLGGGFECNWEVEPADEAATEEPDQRWICVYGLPLAALAPPRTGRRIARGLAAGRLAVPVMG